MGFRLKFAAYSKGIKMLALRKQFIFSGLDYKKVVGSYDSIRMVPRERFNIIYGNGSTTPVTVVKTTFEDIQSDIISRYALVSEGRKSKSFINVSAVNSVMGIDFSKTITTKTAE